MPNFSDEDDKVLQAPPADHKVENFSTTSGKESYFIQKNSPEFAIIEVDPRLCKPWQYHNRDAAWLTPERCKDLILSIQKIGQNEPALARKMPENSEYDYEIIYGVRRWFACSEIPDQPLLIRVIEANDKTCMVLMHSENADSKDISEFERAYSFAKQIKSGVFKSQAEMAEAMGVTQGLISRMIRAAELYEHEWLRSLFQNKIEIKVKPAYRLVTFLRDPTIEPLIRETAEHIRNKLKSGEKMTGDKILKTLLLAANERRTIQEKEALEFSTGMQPILISKRDAAGRLTIMIDRTSKQYTREALIEAFLQVVNRYLAE